MTLDTTEHVKATASPAASGRWIEDWRPEDEAFWEATGKKVARRNLAFSVFSEHIGFSVWSLWSVFVLFLTPAYGLSHDVKTGGGREVPAHHDAHRDRCSGTDPVHLCCCEVRRPQLDRS